MQSSFSDEYDIIKSIVKLESVETYTALERNNNDVVVVRVIRKSEENAAFHTLLKELEQLKSPYLVRYLGCYEDDNEYRIVMENCELESLRDYMKMNVGLNEDALREIASCCLLGLDFLHSHHIIHGNIQPSNLFFSEVGMVKLSDYGLITAECSKVNQSTLWHSAPEVFKEWRELKSDVWSLGYTLVELGERKNPYDGVAYWNWPKDWISKNDAPSLSSEKWSAECVDFVGKCLVKDVKERWGVEQLMEHPFVKESIRSILQDGFSEPLLELAKRWRIQKLNVEYVKSDSEQDYVTVLNHNGLCWFREGIMKQPSFLLAELGLNGVIEVNTDSHELMRVNGEDVKGIEHGQVLDLSDDGARWEGDVLHNQPYGWGVLYDKEGEKVYKGFRIGEVNVCYGTQYYPVVGVIDYEGQWCEGKRWGRGVQYDRNGDVTINGEWMDDGPLNKQVVLNEENQLMHNHIEIMVVSDNSCNGPEWRIFDFSILIKLRELIVGNKCFANVEEMELIGLNELERVVIRENCFKGTRVTGHNPNHHFYLKNCERLRELRIGRRSFSYYAVCVIENLPSLEVIEMGEVNEESSNFRFSSLQLKNLPSLKSLLFGEGAFYDCSRAVFENLPELTSIQLGKHAFRFNDDDESSELVMRSDLPKLISLTTTIRGGAFKYPHYITLENMPSITSAYLPSAFHYKDDVTIIGSIGELRQALSPFKYYFPSGDAFYCSTY